MRFLFLSFFFVRLILICSSTNGRGKKTPPCSPRKCFLLKDHCHSSARKISELQAPDQKVPFRGGLRHLENQQKTITSLKGTHGSRTPRGDDVCSLTEKEGPFPFLLIRYLPPNTKFPYRLGLRTREGKGLSQVTQQASVQGHPNPDVSVALDNSLNHFVLSFKWP